MRKIVSGGQTGVDRAALDVAIKHGIMHGGWVPKGRLAEDGTIPAKYKLQEIVLENYPQRTEKNVMDSDGTLIISNSPLIGGSALSVRMALKHRRPNLHIDLNDTDIFEASVLILNWLRANHIETLNVTGSRASEDPKIYLKTTAVLEDLLLLEAHFDKPLVHVELNMLREFKIVNRPSSVDEAIDLLISDMKVRELYKLANLSEIDLINLHFTLGMWIRKNFTDPKNKKLLKSCREISKDKCLHWAQMHMVIIKQLWKRLQETHKLRVVK
jgi:hypothetical protein